MPRVIRYQHPRREPSQSLVDFLCRRFTYADRNEWITFISRGYVRVNDEADLGTPSPDRMLRQQDRVVFDPPRELEPPVDARMRLVLVNDDVVVVSKSGNIPVSEGGRYMKNTVAYALGERLAVVMPRGREDRGLERDAEPLFTVHRLDKETSGLVVLARHARAARFLGMQFEDHTVSSHQTVEHFDVDDPVKTPVDDLPRPTLQKIYVAVVQGTEGLQANQTIVVENRIGFEWEARRQRSNDNNVERGGCEVASGADESGAPTPTRAAPLEKVKMRCYSSTSTLGKPSRSTVTVLAVSPATATSLVSIELHTGRTHQARLHCAAIGHPIVGDKLYLAGGERSVEDAVYLRRARGEEPTCHDMEDSSCGGDEAAARTMTTRRRVVVYRQLLHAAELTIHLPPSIRVDRGVCDLHADRDVVPRPTRLQAWSDVRGLFGEQHPWLPVRYFDVLDSLCT